MAQTQMLFTLVLLVSQPSKGLQERIRVFQSQVPLGNQDPKFISGAKLNSGGQKVQVEDITLCLRFNYQILEAHEGRSRLVTIADPYVSEEATLTGEDYFQLTDLSARYPMSFFAWGFPRKRGSYKSFFLHDVENGNWEIWATNRWIHLCLAYEKKTGFLKIIKVFF